jgi:hypothetical protein
VQVFDPRLLQLFASGRLIAVWTNYQPYIQAERKRNSDPGLYDQLEIVAKRWQEHSAAAAQTERVRAARR